MNFVRPGFPLGRILITPHALAVLRRSDVLGGLARHVAGDWGELGEEDKRVNDDALAHGGRLLSAYCDGAGTKFWIITEADRSATTVLLPQDY